MFFPSYWLLSHKIIVKTMDSIVRGMNPVAMIITNPWKKYWPRRRSNLHWPPALKSCNLTTELWGSATDFVDNQLDVPKLVQKVQYNLYSKTIQGK